MNFITNLSSIFNRENTKAFIKKNKKKNVLCIFFSVPQEGTGSHVIMLRHLKYLEEEGYEINVVAPQHENKEKNLQKGWKYIFLPKRKMYWPPYRQKSTVLMHIRLWLYLWEIKKVLKDKPEVILTLTWDIYTLLAANLSKSWNVPLLCLLHDQPELMSQNSARVQWVNTYYPLIFKQSKRVLAVSEQLLHNYQISEDKGKILFPVPHKGNWLPAKWRSSFAEKVNLVYAGRIHPYHITYFADLGRILRKVAGSLTLITPDTSKELEQLIKANDNIKYEGFFDTNEQCIAYIREHASALLVLYALDINLQRWATSSFPSKLIEYTQTGLPVVILAPQNASVYQWAIKEQWKGLFNALNEEELTPFFTGLKDEKVWTQLAKQSYSASESYFSPDVIHKEFYDELISL